MTTDQTTITAPTPARQVAYDAIYTLIRALGDHVPVSPVRRNALIWRAVETALDAMDESGRLLPSGGEVSTSPRGLGNAEYARRMADRLYRDLWQSKPARKGTAEHARVLIEKELDALAAEIWGPPVVSDNSEKGAGDG